MVVPLPLAGVRWKVPGVGTEVKVNEMANYGVASGEMDVLRGVRWKVPGVGTEVRVNDMANYGVASGEMDVLRGETEDPERRTQLNANAAEDAVFSCLRLHLSSVFGFVVMGRRVTAAGGRPPKKRRRERGRATNSNNNLQEQLPRATREAQLPLNVPDSVQLAFGSPKGGLRERNTSVRGKRRCVVPRRARRRGHGPAMDPPWTRHAGPAGPAVVDASEERRLAEAAHGGRQDAERLRALRGRDVDVPTTRVGLGSVTECQTAPDRGDVGGGVRRDVRRARRDVLRAAAPPQHAAPFPLPFSRPGPGGRGLRGQRRHAAEERGALLRRLRAAHRRQRDAERVLDGRRLGRRPGPLPPLEDVLYQARAEECAGLAPQPGVHRRRGHRGEARDADDVPPLAPEPGNGGGPREAARAAKASPGRIDEGFRGSASDQISRHAEDLEDGDQAERAVGDGRHEAEIRRKAARVAIREGRAVTVVLHPEITCCEQRDDRNGDGEEDPEAGDDEGVRILLAEVERSPDYVAEERGLHHLQHEIAVLRCEHADKEPEHLSVLRARDPVACVLNALHPGLQDDGAQQPEDEHLLQHQVLAREPVRHPLDVLRPVAHHVRQHEVEQREHDHGQVGGQRALQPGGRIRELLQPGDPVGEVVERGEEGDRDAPPEEEEEDREDGEQLRAAPGPRRRAEVLP
eukprot:gene10172-biopygen5115